MFEELEDALVPAEEHGQLCLEELVSLGKDGLRVWLTPRSNLLDRACHLRLDGEKEHVERHSTTHSKGTVQLGVAALGRVVGPDLEPTTPATAWVCGIWSDVG